MSDTNNSHNFNYFEYINNYKDLEHLNETQAYKHYIIHGINENRTFHTNNLKSFNPNIYKNL